MVFEIPIVLVLIVLNGLFALAELAIVNARRPRLQALVESGRRGGAAAITLAEDPGRFLSTVQIGITLISILTGMFSGSALGHECGLLLGHAGVPKGFAEPLGFALVVSVITYLTLVIGELVPKRFALRNPEPIACAVAPAITELLRVAAPAVWLLDASTDAVFRLFRVRPEPESTVSDAEIHSVVEEAAGAGVIAPAERSMISGVMRLGDRPVRGVMTPRADVNWIDLTAGEDAIRRALTVTQHSRLPVGDGSAEGMLGVVQTRELLSQMLAGEPLDVRARTRVAPVIPDIARALDALALLRGAEVPMALVHDEYGHFVGVVTPADVLETIAGVFRADADTPEPGAVPRADGSWILAGSLPVDEMADHLALRLPAERDYDTVAGYVLAALRRVPVAGERFVVGDWRFEIVSLDGQRIDKLIAVSGPEPGPDVASANVAARP